MAWDITGNNGTNPNNNFLGTIDNEPLVIRTNNTERLRVVENGNVGIGTGHPNKTLSVNGTIETAYEGIYFGGMFGVGGNDYYYGVGARQSDSLVYDTFQYHRWRVGTNEKMTLDGSGNLGIGTTSPNYPLHVVNANGDAIDGRSDYAGPLTNDHRGFGGIGVHGQNDQPGGIGVQGDGFRFGVWGRSVTFDGVGGESQSGNGVSGTSITGTGVSGHGNIQGVFGFSLGGSGVSGQATTGTGVAAVSESGTGVSGTSSNAGVVGFATANLIGSPSPPGGSIGVYGESLDTVAGVGVTGKSYNAGVMAFNSQNRNAAYLASGCCAAYLVGEVAIIGHLSKSSGGFLIDHPLDPANKFFSHSFVESPDMKNIYDGVVMMDVNGEAMIELPAWFEAINTNFRYQLTCIGGHAPVYIAQEVLGNRFKIAGGTPSMRVSWQVTGIRQDAWATAHRVRVEEEKSIEERGNYLHPELHGAPSEISIERIRHPIPQRTQQIP